MQHYWFHAIPLKKCDQTINATFEFYKKKFYQKHQSLWEIEWYPHCLKSVDGGDTIFICAHGHEGEGFISSTPDRDNSPHKLTVAKLADLLQLANLRNWSSRLPIWIKLLVCWAGGPSLTSDQFNEFFDHRSVADIKISSIKRESNSLRNLVRKPRYSKIDASPDIILAKALAIELKNRGLDNVCVGGYFGKLSAHLDRIKTIEVLSERGGIGIDSSVQHSAIYYDGDGVFVQRRNDPCLDKVKLLRKY